MVVMVRYWWWHSGVSGGSDSLFRGAVVIVVGAL